MLIDLSGEGPALGSLQALLEGEDDDETGPPALPEIELVDGLAVLLTPLGPADIAVSGQARSDGEGGLTAALSYHASSGLARLRGAFEGGLEADGAMALGLTIDEGTISLTPAEGGIAAEISGLTGELQARLRDGRPEQAEGRLALTDLGLEQARFRDADLTFSLSEGGIKAGGKLRARDDKLGAAFQAELRDPLGEAAFGLGLSLAASAEAALFDLVAQPFSSGQGTATLQAAGRLPPLPLDDQDLGLATRLLRGQVDGRFTLNLSQLAVPDLLSGLDVKSDGTLRLADGAARILLAPGTAGQIAALDPAWLAAIGLPPALADHCWAA